MAVVVFLVALYSTGYPTGTFGPVTHLTAAVTVAGSDGEASQTVLAVAGLACRTEARLFRWGFAVFLSLLLLKCGNSTKLVWEGMHIVGRSTSSLK